MSERAALLQSLVPNSLLSAFLLFPAVCSLLFTI
jgi:hypothetical protein